MGERPKGNVKIGLNVRAFTLSSRPSLVAVCVSGLKDLMKYERFRHTNAGDQKTSLELPLSQVF